MAQVEYDADKELIKQLEKEINEKNRLILKLNNKNYQNKKLDLWSLYVPFHRITQLRVPVALIITPGKQIIIRKLPKKKEYFIDKELGMFQIKPEYVFFIGKTATYLYDIRNQNPIDPGILNELWKWANFQGLYKIRRADVEHAKRLRNKDLSNLHEEVSNEKRALRTFGHKVIDSIKKQNEVIEKRKKEEAGSDDDKEEYKKFSDDDQNFIIIKNMYENGYIKAEQATILNHDLTTRQIRSTDDLLNKLESFCDVYVSKPIPIELERVLDDYHTYKPQDIIPLISQLAKIHKGLKGLRTKPVINWFPATYLLFGALGVIIIIMIWATYGNQINIFGSTPPH